MGVNLASDNELKQLADAIQSHAGPWTATPLVPGAQSGETDVGRLIDTRA